MKNFQRKKLKPYIFLEQNDIHPDILVDSQRLSLTEEVEQAARKLNLQLKNNDQCYIGNITQKNSIDLLTSINSCNNSIYMAEFLSTLISGVKGKPVYEGNKNQIDKNLLENILSDITEQIYPYRGEWYNTSFTQIKSVLQIIYKKFDQQGNIVKVSEPLDPDTLMSDRFPGIDLKSWVENPTSHGLPRKEVKGGNTLYCGPREDNVVRFSAGSSEVALYCSGGSMVSVSNLGVRRAWLYAKY